MKILKFYATRKENENRRKLNETAVINFVKSDIRGATQGLHGVSEFSLTGAKVFN